MPGFGSDVGGFGFGASTRAKIAETTNDASSASGYVAPPTDTAPPGSDTPPPAHETQATSPVAPVDPAHTSQSASDNAKTEIPAVVQGITPDPDDDLTDVPAHLHERTRELIQQKRTAREEANQALEQQAAYEARIAELEAKATTGAAPATDTQNQQADALAAVQVTQAEQTYDAAKTQYDAILAGKIEARKGYMERLQAKVYADEITLKEANDQLAADDAFEDRNLQALQLELGKLELARDRAQIAERARVDTVKASVKPVIETHKKTVPASIIEHYAVQGYDPGPIAQYFAQEYAPLMAGAVSDATAPLIAAHEAAIKVKDAEIARLTKLAGNMAAAPNTMSGAAQGNPAAPSNGTYTPPPNKFGYGDMVKNKIAQMQRRA